MYKALLPVFWALNSYKPVGPRFRDPLNEDKGFFERGLGQTVWGDIIVFSSWPCVETPM